MFSKRLDHRDELIRELRDERDELRAECKRLRARNEKLADDLVAAVNPGARVNIQNARQAEYDRTHPRPLVQAPSDNGDPDTPFLDMMHDHLDVREALGIRGIPFDTGAPPPQRHAERPADERPPPKE